MCSGESFTLTLRFGLAQWPAMTPEPQTGEQQPDHYDAFADAYARVNENGLFNRWYARPAVLDLLGDVAGRRILDAGCGSGPLLADLTERSARAAGFDASPVMIQLARERLGGGADLKVADLTQPLPYDSEAFDDALAVLCCTTSRSGRGRWPNCAGC
jgi:SAM-dependent methyltransferase